MILFQDVKKVMQSLKIFRTAGCANLCQPIKCGKLQIHIIMKLLERYSGCPKFTKSTYLKMENVTKLNLTPN